MDIVQFIQKHKFRLFVIIVLLIILPDVITILGATDYQKANGVPSNSCELNKLSNECRIITANNNIQIVTTIMVVVYFGKLLFKLFNWIDNRKKRKEEKDINNKIEDMKQGA